MLEIARTLELRLPTFNHKTVCAFVLFKTSWIINWPTWVWKTYLWNTLPYNFISLSLYLSNGIPHVLNGEHIRNLATISGFPRDGFRNNSIFNITVGTYIYCSYDLFVNFCKTNPFFLLNGLIFVSIDT